MQWIAALILIVLSSCNFKPHYERPYLDVCDTWRFDQCNDENFCANIRWWEELGDPVLNDLILSALRNNQDLQAATARVLEFYAQFRIIASQLLPEIDLGGSYTRQELSNALNFAPVPPGTRTNSLYNLAFTLSYEIDFWSQIQNATEASAALYLSEIQTRRTVILTLISALASAYIQLLQYDAQLEVSRLTYESRLESWKLAQLRFEGGLVSEMEVMQAESEADSAAVQVKNFEILIPQQEDLISILVGMPPQAIPRGKLLTGLYSPPSVPAGIPSDLLSNRPDILQAELQLIAANAQIGVARAAFFPTINLTGAYGFESTVLHNLFQNPAKTWDWGISILQPIFTGWRLTYQLRQAEALTQEAVHVYLQTYLTALKEVDDALIAHQKTKEIVDVQAQEVAALAVYLKLSILRYNNGQNDYLTVLDAERRLFQAQLALAQSQAEIFLTLIGIYKALGGGWVVDADYCLTNHAPDIVD